MIKKIEISTSTPKNLWCKFIHDNRYFIGCKILEIDLRKCSFIEPFHLVSLAFLIEEYYINHVEIEFINQYDNIELYEYLSSINFFNLWIVNRLIEPIPAVKRNSLNLYKIKSESISEYVALAKKYFEDNFDTNKDWYSLNIALAELFNNIVDHSESVVLGFTITQYYPTLGKVKIAICDFGLGIPTTINAFLRNQDNNILLNHRALQKAFEAKVSSKKHPHNRGVGLNHIFSIINSQNGSLKVVSNNAMCKYEDGFINSFEIEHNFTGTNFEIILNVNKFEDFNQEDLIEEFAF
jgi:hypothetical protein